MVPGSRVMLFQYGQITWNPTVGKAFETHGDIYTTWVANGREGGALGLPTSDEHDWQGGRASTFEKGSITWPPTTVNMGMTAGMVGAALPPHARWQQSGRGEMPISSRRYTQAMGPYIRR
jgi:uncharacterized protein with LGFP repeats